MNTTHTGSCLCGEIKYEIHGGFDAFYLCHCKHCQKDTGSAHAANLVSTTAELRWLTGEQRIKVYHLPSTRHSRSFCEVCASPVPSLIMEGTMLIAPAGGLDSEVPRPPDAHMFVTSKASWETDLDKIKQFETFPS